MQRVLAVDDAECNSTIYETAFKDSDEIEYLGCLAFSDALERDDWTDVDTVLLDLGQQNSPTFDRFAGCRVAARIRSLHPLKSGSSPIITVVTRWIELEGVRARAAEAGVDYWYRRDELVAFEDWRQVVLNPTNEIPEPDIEEVRRVLGLKATVSIEDAAQELEEATSDHDLEPGVLSKTYGQRTKFRARTDVIRARMSSRMNKKPADIEGVDQPADPRKPPTVKQLVILAGETMRFPDE